MTFRDLLHVDEGRARQIRFFPLPETKYRLTEELAFTTVITQANYPAYEGVLKWCIERFGHPGNGTWYIHDVTFWFTESDHAMEFKLRWV